MEEQGDEFYDDDEVSELSSSPTIPEGEIDFNFVYALHTFLATVEGQATSQKGDTLVLLDDSNSYWWLVRNVKDQSIGYLPAEHIETPAERLARLNKHRNVDITSSQTTDIPTIPRPSRLKKLTSRKPGSRSVAFSSPKFIEYVAYESEDDYEGEDILHVTDETQMENGPAVAGHHHVSSIEINDVTADLPADHARGPRPETAETEHAASATRFSLTPINTVETANSARSGSLTSTESRGPVLDGKTHGHQGSRGSLHSETSAASTVDETDSKEKKKKGVFSGLFKKKSKREKSSEPEAAPKGVDVQTHSEVHLEKNTPGAQEVHIVDPERPSEPLALPMAVNEMRSSVLMQVDPVVAEMIDEPTHRGPIDEVEMMQSHRLRSPDLQSEHRDAEPDTFAWNDTNIASYLKADENRLRNTILLITQQAQVEKARTPSKYNTTRLTKFNDLTFQVDGMLKV